MNAAPPYVRQIMKQVAAALCVALLAGSLRAETLTLPAAARPEWLRRDGIVMAGSWEPLVFRVRRDGRAGYAPTPEERAAYEREHSPEMVARLKSMGVNFVMMHCYKGAGMDAERESMADAVRFARLCHDAGLRVGVYAYSGTLLWELFDKEVPPAKDWLLRDAAGNPLPYGKAAYRHYCDRNHPDAEAYLKRVVRFAVEDIKADLVHLDNYVVGPGWDANSTERFRRYLGATFTPQQRAAMGAEDAGRVRPPTAGSPELLRRAWCDFSCASLAESYLRMTRYARNLRPDVLMEVNPGGVLAQLQMPVDHGRLLQGGEAFWDEGRRPEYRNGELQSRIRTYKVARRMGNSAFTYVTTPLEMAESMAFNLDTLGAICWFEYGKIVKQPGSVEALAAETAPFVRFYHARHKLLRDAAVVADVAVLRSFPSMAFSPPREAVLTGQVEQALIDRRVCFQIIYDHQLSELTPLGLRPSLQGYRALVVANCTALSDGQIEQIRRYVQAGGRLCVIGPPATHDQWMLARPKPALDDLPADRVVRMVASDDWVSGIRRACDEQVSLEIDGPRGLACELTEQPGRRLLHLVNYRTEQPAANVAVRLEVPPARRAQSVVLASPEHAGDQPLSFQQEGRTVRFTVPRVGVYEIAVVTFQQ